MPFTPGKPTDPPSGFDPGTLPNFVYGAWGDEDAGPGLVGSSGKSAAATPVDGTVETGAGLLGVNEAPRGVGVQGFCAQGTGVAGQGGGAGVAGHGVTGPGVLGTSTNDVGVSGQGGGASAGVSGTGTTGPGVSGGSTQGPGVSGSSVQGPGIAGTGGPGPGVTGTSTGGPGVSGTSTAGPGLSGASAPGPGALGTSTQGAGVSGTSGSGPGLAGSSTTGPGVSGTSTPGPGVLGTSTQGAGVSGSSNTGPGVMGTSTASTGVAASSTSGSAVTASSTSGTAVAASSNSGIAVDASTSTTSTAIRAYSFEGSAVSGRCGHYEGPGGEGFGWNTVPNREPAVEGITFYGPGVFAYSHHGTGLEAYGEQLGADITGGLHVNGQAVTTGGAALRIDHPLAPADAVLTHAFVASPERKNVYDGVVTLDDQGTATVTLPDWFEALNQEFRYQLTSLGVPAPDLHVDQQITDNYFTVSGGVSGQQVSWQVTGVRADRWAQANPVTTVEAKPVEQQGFFHHPDLFGQSPEKGITMARFPVAGESPKEV